MIPISGYGRAWEVKREGEGRGIGIHIYICLHKETNEMVYLCMMGRVGHGQEDLSI